jgi:ABC-2 type transport system ATP-binding protein
MNLMTEAVKIRGLVKNYNGLVAVNNLDLTVPEGSVYGFLGPNGAGKTTTLKMIAGMTEPTSGEIEIMGKKVSFGSNQNREMIGYLPDVPGFYDWMSPVVFLNFSGSLYNIEKSVLKSRIVELLKLVNLYKQRNKKIGTFSRGMKQRLGIAQALINNPKVVLLDEPVSALDPIGRKEVIDIISSLSEKVTVFFSSHILADVERICDRVVIINEGKKLLEDSIEHIREVPDVRELEIELETKEDVLKLEAIKDLDFVEEVVVDNLKILIKAQDIDKLRAKLNQIFNEENILVKKMVVKELSLEDIFIKVVNNHDQA